MAAIDDAINKLSPDELDLLNSDPKMLSDFKAKYAQPEMSVGDKLKLGIKALGATDIGYYPETGAKDLAGMVTAPISSVIDTAKGLSDPTEMLAEKALGVGQGIKNFASDPVGSIAAHPATTAVSIMPLVDWADTTFGKSVQNDLSNAVDVNHPSLIQKIKNVFTQPPTEEEVNIASQKVADSLKEARVSANKQLNDVKAKLDLDQDFNTRVGNLGKETPSLTDLRDQYQNYFNPPTESTPPSLAKEQFSGDIKKLWADKAQQEGMGKLETASYQNPDAFKNTDEPARNGQGLTPKAEIGQLYQLKQDLQEQLSRSTKNAMGQDIPAVSTADQSTIQGMIKKINDRIEQIPGGSDLRNAERQFSDVRDVYDDLQKQMATPGKAQDYLRRLFTSDSGVAADSREKLAFIQQVTGKNSLSDLFDLFKQQATISAKDLYPSSLAAQGLQDLGKVYRTGKSLINPALASSDLAVGLQKPFNNAQMQSLRDRLKNNAK